MTTQFFTLTAPRYTSGEWRNRAAALRNFFRQALEQVEILPEVEAASIGTLARGLIRVRRASGLPVLESGMQRVSPNYFRTLGIPLLEGREFSAYDDPSSDRVAVINHKLAATLFAERNPIGYSIEMIYPAYGSTARVRVIGVCADVRQGGPEGPIRPEIYTSLRQEPLYHGFLFVRFKPGAASDWNRITRAIREVDPDLPVEGAPMRLSEVWSGRVFQERGFYS